MRHLTALLPLLALACTPTPYRLGVRAAADGRTFEAAGHWITALDADVVAAQPRARLLETAPEAWKERWSVAQEHEASGRFAEALAVYDELFAFEKELVELELLTFSTREAHAQQQQTIANWATAERKAGDAAEEQGRLVEAIAHYDKVRELVPGSGGLDPKQALTLRKLAEEDLARFRYEDASAHYRRSFELSGDRSVDAWATAIDVALARYALAQGRCRAAITWFERAGDAPWDPELPADRARAADCARVGVLIDPVSEEVALKAGAAALGPMFTDLLEERVGGSGSKFVRLLSEDALAAANNPPAHRVRVVARITQAAVEPKVTTERKATTDGERVTPCDKETARVDPEAVCTEPVTVEYVEQRTAVTVRLAGSVRIVDLVTGEQQTRPLELAREQAVLNAVQFHLFEAGTTLATQVAAEAAPGRVAVPAAVLELDRPPPPLPPEGQLVADAVRELADAAGLAVLELVDQEPALVPAKRLDIRDPHAVPVAPMAPAPMTPAPMALPPAPAPGTP